MILGIHKTQNLPILSSLFIRNIQIYLYRYTGILCLYQILHRLPRCPITFFHNLFILYILLVSRLSSLVHSFQFSSPTASFQGPVSKFSYLIPSHPIPSHLAIYHTHPIPIPYHSTPTRHKTQFQLPLPASLEYLLSFRARVIVRACFSYLVLGAFPTRGARFSHALID